ncbi:TetR/AcrR family transcriptional regulator [Actinomyces viscosus]|uniref:Bacterial regulatory proteins, tetR family n=1 Tax=Actinomyces viscosus TaxID=1656 RepID=A0A3S4WIG5_ACTVI|nr:TetR/AcrR family transcriptional regulator [Actinomyces viscosus]TFH50915.1 TetR/AcrR family transcriptional regulator [Actinomyces viscosus]VEI14723.1 Bacterial regulatory proteins, tetR family [Actinomyces viscosus]
MPRAGLSTQRVVERAAQIVDEHGYEALSLSRLAADLGVAPPSLYKHVAGMSDLVQQISVRAVDELAECLAVSVMGLAGRDALSALAETYRAFAHEHPGLYPMTQFPREVSDRETNPMHSTAARRTVDVVTAALSGYRIPDERVVDAVRMTRSALHGFVDIELRGGFAMEASIDVSFATLVDSLDAALTALGRPSN